MLTSYSGKVKRINKLIDKRNIIEAAIMPIPETGLGVAINDRLRRASKK